MRGLERLCGNAPVKRRLEAGRGLSHAYILAGPAGCGKRTLAGLLSQALVCAGAGEVPCGACPHCRKAAAGIHPDIQHWRPEKRDFTVGQVRAIRSDAYLLPNEAGRKVYVLEDAQALNEEAQNALLKLLEEGPAYAAFLLLTDHAGALLPTVRSRCELLSLSPVTPGEAEDWLRRRFPQAPPDQVRQAAQRCEGALGRAVAWLEGGGEALAELQERSRALSRLLLEGPEEALLERCVALEKESWEGWRALLSETVLRLREALDAGADRRRALALIALLRELEEAIAHNVGTGSLAGWLCAGAASLSPPETTEELTR